MALRINATVVTKFLTALMLLACMHLAIATGATRLPGTYSSLKYNVEGGDLVGFEVRVVPTNLGTKAVVQVAEGDAGRIYIVDVAEKSGIVSFEIPLAAGLRAGFKGKVTSKGLDGTITYPSGEHKVLFLPRCTSYWER